MILLLALLSVFTFSPDPQNWSCSNPLEIRCSDGKCDVAREGAFTPMSVSFSDKGSLSVCAYSGCWEGTADVTNKDGLLSLSARDLPFSTNKDSRQSIALLFDQTDRVALLKAGEFAHPLVCKISD